MYDLLEGVCRYDLSKILYNFIYVEQFSTLQVFNERLLNCTNSYKDNVLFNSESIKDEKIIITAFEMYCLVTNFSLLINDLLPEKNLTCQLYLFLKRIINISCSHFLTSKCINLFD